MAEFLLELFSEEIPARLQNKAAADLMQLVTAGLKAGGLEFTRAHAFATPRRLTLVIDDLALVQPDTSEERKGPNAEAPAAAIEGFLKSVGLARDQVETRKTPKGDVLFAVLKKQGRPTAGVLAVMLADIIRNFPWPKSQRWGAGSLRWVRPLQAILALLDGKTIALEVDGIVAGNITHGHRFLAPGSIKVSAFADYRTKLEAAYVLIDGRERAAKIDIVARDMAQRAGLELIPDEALLDEVAGLVEWPVVLMGKIDEAFMEVPAEALMATMRANQKYFSLRNPKSKKLASPFILVSNMETEDKGAAIIAGNERVLRARLSDAKFFWDLDRKTPLEQRLPALDNIIFHAKLGSVGARVARIARLAESFAPYIPGCDAAKAARAASLCKADLVTGMVGEFPELQGIMGRYYALGQGEDAAVAEAIAEHYSPKGPSDDCPKAPVSVALALAEKIDTLAGFFHIGEKPTGSKDPFALRRAALGVIRLIIENNLRLGLAGVFNQAISLYNPTKGHAETAAASREILDFFADRLKVHLREAGVRHDLISAIFALGDEDDLLRLMARVEALKNFLSTEDGANLLIAYKRAANILRIEEKKDNSTYEGQPEPEFLQVSEEVELCDSLPIVEKSVVADVANEKYEAAMSSLAGLRGPIDAFFDKVTVNCDDEAVRQNRLRILGKIRTALHTVADFSKIEG